MNLYAYVGNNPINGIDPLGLYASSLVDSFQLNFSLAVNAGANITVPFAIPVTEVKPSKVTSK